MELISQLSPHSKFSQSTEYIEISAQTEKQNIMNEFKQIRPESTIIATGAAFEPIPGQLVTFQSPTNRVMDERAVNILKGSKLAAQRLQAQTVLTNSDGEENHNASQQEGQKDYKDEVISALQR